VNDVIEGHRTDFECLRGGCEGDAEAGAGGEGDEHFETELLPSARDQVGHTGLTDARNLRGLGLRQLPGLDDLAQDSVTYAYSD
jgi:hypothetical protein